MNTVRFWFPYSSERTILERSPRRTGTPVAPPQLDESFCVDEAHPRARELAEIGLSEDAAFT